jgi:hypothetical protein
MRRSAKLAALLEAIALTVLVAGAVGAQSPSPSSPAAGTVEPLAGGPASETDPRMDLVRITLPPGAIMGPIAQLGTSVSRVESGSIVVRADRGVVIANDGTAVAAGDEVSLDQHDTVVEGPDAVMTWRNEGAVAAVVLSMRLVHETPVEPVPSPSPDRGMTGSYNAERIRSSGRAGARDQVIVHDRSGLVMDVRFPTAAEARFVGGDTAGSSPLHVLPTHRKELLIHWLSAGCGPKTWVDISRDLGHIRVRDQGPDCPDGPRPRAVVLNLTGPWFDSTGLDIWVERDPG